MRSARERERIDARRTEYHAAKEQKHASGTIHLSVDSCTRFFARSVQERTGYSTVCLIPTTQRQKDLRLFSQLATPFLYFICAYSTSLHKTHVWVLKQWHSACLLFNQTAHLTPKWFTLLCYSSEQPVSQLHGSKENTRSASCGRSLAPGRAPRTEEPCWLGREAHLAQPPASHSCLREHKRQRETCILVPSLAPLPTY